MGRVTNAPSTGLVDHVVPWPIRPHREGRTPVRLDGNAVYVLHRIEDIYDFATLETKTHVHSG